MSLEETGNKEPSEMVTGREKVEFEASLSKAMRACAPSLVDTCYIDQDRVRFPVAGLL